LNNRPTANLKISVTWSLELAADVPTFREINGSDVPPAGEQIQKSRSVHKGPSRLQEVPKFPGCLTAIPPFVTHAANFSALEIS
jgi:hypothetical protein